jgi:glycosyltransferase involved in cell wall biosynthesis
MICDFTVGFNLLKWCSILMTEVLIHSPFARQASQGNSVTADRLERILIEKGISVVMEEDRYRGVDAECLIALNARRSAEVVADFGRACPDGKIIVILTGTDINHPEMEDAGSPTRQTMDRADVLVVLHEAEFQSVPEHLHEKCRIIYPSVHLPAGIRHRPDTEQGVGEGAEGSFQVMMAGNLRIEKNPRLAVDACRLLSGNPGMAVASYGDATGDIADEMRRASAELGNFEWLRKIDHTVLLQKMERADLLLNTSTQEGGANAICEAISLGLPVVASRIRGNIGMLGDGYAGFFPSGDARALADLLLRCATDRVFYSKLKSQIADRAPHFAYATEAAAWTDLVRSQLVR